MSEEDTYYFLKVLFLLQVVDGCASLGEIISLFGGNMTCYFFDVCIY